MDRIAYCVSGEGGKNKIARLEGWSTEFALFDKEKDHAMMQFPDRSSDRTSSVTPSSPKISVIIPVRNEAAGIAECLEAVYNQSYQPHEVIVVDGHSTDGTVLNAKRWPVKIVYEDYHTRAGACQVGIENSTGEYIAFTDADCIPDEGWLKNLITEFDDSKLVGLAGATKQKVEKGFWPESISLALGTFLGSGESIQWRVYNNKHYIRSSSGCNSIYRRHGLLEVGGFNTGLSGGEDEEINKRISRIGRLAYIPMAVISHNHKISSVKSFARRMYKYGFWRAESRTWALRVIPPLLVPLLLLSLALTPWILMGAICAYIAIVSASGLKFAVQGKQALYAFSIPFVYLTGHVSYSLGFWRGVIPPIKKKYTLRQLCGLKQK